MDLGTHGGLTDPPSGPTISAGRLLRSGKHPFKSGGFCMCISVVAVVFTPIFNVAYSLAAT